MFPAQIMMPADFVRRYHRLEVHDPFLGMIRRAEATGYGTGWGWNGKQKDGNRPGGNVAPGTPDAKPDVGKLIQKEHGNFKRAVQMLHHGDPNTNCPTPFFFVPSEPAIKQPKARTTRNSTAQSKSHKKPPLPLPPRLSRTQAFNQTAMMWAFGGKGSPEEIEAALELAIATGRIAPRVDGTHKDVAGASSAKRPDGGFYTLEGYCERFMTLDCLTLTAHYYGVNRNSSKEFYVDRPRARTTIESIQPKDVLVTFENKEKGIIPVHVAIVQSFAKSATPPQNKRPGAASESIEAEAVIEIVEWGEPSKLTNDDQDKHIRLPKKVTVRMGKLRTDLGLCYVSSSGNERYFFAPPPPQRT